MSNSITAEELKTIKDQQLELNKLLTQIGVVESQKHALLHQVGIINEGVEVTKKELEEKYGSVSINLETGEYEEIKSTEIVE